MIIDTDDTHPGAFNFLTHPLRGTFLLPTPQIEISVSSFDLSAVVLTPYADSHAEFHTCAHDLECCCDTIGVDDCEFGGSCDSTCITTFENGEYRINYGWDAYLGFGQLCTANSDGCTVRCTFAMTNPASYLYGGDLEPALTYEYSSSGKICVDSADWCTDSYAGVFEVIKLGSLAIDDCVDPLIGSCLTMTGTLWAFDGYGAVAPPCDCKCPYLEFRVDVSGFVAFSATDGPFDPDCPDGGCACLNIDNPTFYPTGGTLVYRKRLTRAKALTYHTHYDWINDTTEPFRLQGILSIEDGTEVFKDHDGVSGEQATCSGETCPGCSSVGGSAGTAPTEYSETYSLCSEASSEITYAPALNSSAIQTYPIEIELVASAQAPTIASITPSVGTTAGGTVVTILGNYIWGCHSITICGVECGSFSEGANYQPGTVSFTTPAHSAGACTVTLHFSWGTVSATFTYV